MTERTLIRVDRYDLVAEYYYEPNTHLWVEPRDAKRFRFGFDPLGSESSGDIVAISFLPPGTRAERGEPFGSVEAAKFVGPLLAPLSGAVLGHNEEVLAYPRLLGEKPNDAWMIEMAPDDPEEALSHLLHGPGDLRPWFEEEAKRYRAKGMIAE